MQLKNFQIGSKAYMLDVKDSYNNPDKWKQCEVTVTKIGRLYVTVQQASYSNELKFGKVNDSDEYLTENTEIGHSRYLFLFDKGVNSIEEYKRKRQLTIKLRNMFSSNIERRYTIAQLEAIEKILEETNNND